MSTPRAFPRPFRMLVRASQQEWPELYCSPLSSTWNRDLLDIHLEFPSKSTLDSSHQQQFNHYRSRPLRPEFTGNGSELNSFSMIGTSTAEYIWIKTWVFILHRSEEHTSELQ